VAFLVDTNVLVYRHDPRVPRKQARAIELLRAGLRSGEARIPHQAIVEFVAATTRPLRSGGPSLLSADESRREAEELVNDYPVLYPTEALLRLALRGAAAYGLGWFDAHLWAYAEHFGLPLLYSEDFQHDRAYGSVRVQDPFRG
jgi:predicted nucleic acid-binding protein